MNPLVRIAALVALLGVEASAEERRSAIVAGTPEVEAVVRRVAEELRALGHDVEVSPRDSDLGKLRMRARTGDAATVVLVRENDVEITVATSDGPRTKHIARAEADDPGTTALAVAELVRGELAHVDAAPRTASSAPIADTTIADRWVPSPAAPRSLTTRIGVGALVGTGDMPTQTMVALGAGWRISPKVAVEASALVGLPGANLPEGTSQPLWTTAISIGGGYAVLSRERFEVTTGAGAAFAAVTYRDDNKRQARFSVVPFLNVDARIRLAGRLSLTLDTMGGAALPTVELKLKSGERATFGLPFVVMSVGLERSW